ncbi:MAG TPA: polynucleotide adenylyltransferase PcnB [Gammaproteobacteria bacterium]|nr:polynucleotide adenylyltransferase PcnB [Gammaproteobacteria bacterium]
MSHFYMNVDNRTEASIASEQISINALKVIRRLTEHGYEAYLVGGGVRDIILGRKPKDFDVATNAHPDEVHELFRNSRLIGRRFKIVHVHFGGDIVEVATFRAARDDAKEDIDTEDEDQLNQTESGMLLADNVYGEFEEDVFRRDFTINALYYDPEKEEVIDLVDGEKDLKSQTITLIGEPENRYREDPVRMIRAIRFKAMLGFSINEASAEPMRELGYLLQDISPARLFEEFLKLFMSGYAAAVFEELLRYELFGWVFPDSRRAMDYAPAEKLIRAALDSTDRRIAEDLPVTPAFIYAAFLWYPFVEEKKRLEEEGVSHVEASNEAAANILAKQQLFTSIPRRFSGPMRDIWYLQYRLPNRNKAQSLVRHKRFRAAYDFLLLREQAGEKLDNLGEWWTEYQDANETERQTMKPKPKRRRRRRRRERPT